MAWLAVFFLVPMVYLGKTSLEQGLFPIFTFQWAWGNFHDAISLYHTQFVRSFEYAGLATVIALVGSYPLAYRSCAASISRWSICSSDTYSGSAMNGRKLYVMPATTAVAVARRRPPGLTRCRC